MSVVCSSLAAIGFGSASCSASLLEPSNFTSTSFIAARALARDRVVTAPADR